MTDAERAVVEAAKECVAKHCVGTPYATARAWVKLRHAVQALEEVE